MGIGQFLAIAFYLEFILHSNATLIASSKIVNCGRKNVGLDPRKLDNKRCSKKFVVALTVENGQVNTETWF
jgi:hypothetical protein